MLSRRLKLTGDIRKKRNVFSIQLYLHYSWIFAFILITIMGYTLVPEAFVTWRRILLGVATALIFLGMMILRQYAINLIALSRGIPLSRVNLYFIGGLPGIVHEYSSHLVELLIGVSGLLFSFVGAIIFYAAYTILVVTNSYIISGLFSWLLFFSVIFAIFHIIPAYPLDGGRILRAFLWKSTGDYHKATRITTLLAKGTGILLIAGGAAVLFFSRQWIYGGFLIVAGWTLFKAASYTDRLTTLFLPIRNVTAKEAITRECPMVNAEDSLITLVNDHILSKGHFYFAVTQNDILLGSVTLNNIKAVSKKFWRDILTQDIMVPVARLMTIRVDQSAADALEKMMELDVEVMPVVDGEKMTGLLFRDDLINLSQMKRELKIS